MARYKPIRFQASAMEWLSRGEMSQRIRETDWSKTPLGPIAAWPQSLRSTVSICLDSRHPIAIWLGPERTMLYNDAYRPMLGEYKHPQFLGRSGQECWAEIWDIVGPMMEQVVATGESTWSENLLLLMSRFGYLEETYFSFSYSPIRNEHGHPWGIFCASTETTSRVITERRLKTLLQMALDARTTDEAAGKCIEIIRQNPRDIPFALVYLIDDAATELRLSAQTGLAAGTFASSLRVNLEANETAGWPIAQVMAQGTSALVENLASRFEGLPAEPWGEPAHQAMVFPMTRPGRVRPTGVLVFGISPRLAYDDGYRGFFELTVGHVATAVANASAYEEERQNALALAEIDRAKTAFFSNVSHEFRTPLTLMLGPIEETLASVSSSLAEADRERLELAHRNAMRLLKLVNSLLDFARIEAGRMQASYRPTDLAIFTAELASMFESAVETAGLQFIVDCPALPEPVYVDTDLWEKIVTNLVSNAFKFTLQGSIAVRMHWQDGQAVLTVTDTGIGVPEKELPRLFERFHQVPNTRSRTYEGSGIGLALVRELVKLHGGTICVDSSPDIGSIFTVSLPGGTAHLPSERIGIPSHKASTTLGVRASVEEVQHWLPERSMLPALPDTGAAHRPRILWADDNADMRTYVQGLLEPYWNVEAVSDGQLALESALREPPDLVLSDVMMPNLDGIGLLQALRADTRTTSIPVILLSAQAGEEARVAGLEAGADDYLVKPFGARELLARVSTHLGIARLRHEAIEMAQHDALTGLPNRKLSYAFAERLLDSARRGTGHVAVMFIDMDLFKPINDTYGHEVGDAVLQEVGRRLKACVRGEDTAGRLGGDEFLVVLSHIRGAADAAKAAQHIVAILSQPYRVGELSLDTTPSIGISLFPDDAADIDSLLQCADVAMYNAKERGRGNFQLFTPTMNESTELHLRIENQLRSGFDNAEFELHYQPIVDVSMNKVIGVEALMRWPATGIGPSDFIPVAETSGMIGPMGEWALDTVCQQASHWLAQGLPPLTVSINISSLEYRLPLLHDKIVAALAKYGMPPESLQLELTETTLLKNPDEALSIMLAIKQLGVKLALDDFGHGFSSLGLLGRLPLDTIKVDQEFVKKLSSSDRANVAITEAIIGICQTLGLNLVGEGVDSAGVQEFLLGRNCPQMQGYYLCPPLPAAEFEEWYRGRLAA